MLQVALENILTEEDALQRIQEIFQHVENNKEIYVITKAGRPVFAIVDIDHLEQNMNGLSVGRDTIPTLDTAAIAPSPAPITPPMPAAPVSPFPPAPAPVNPPLAPPPAPLPPVAPPTSTIPPLSGSVNLPDLPEDLQNDSPLA